MKRPSITLPSISWNGLIYYGEVFGFLLAWIGGVVLVSNYSTQDEPNDWAQVATVDTLTQETLPVDSFGTEDFAVETVE